VEQAPVRAGQHRQPPPDPAIVRIPYTHKLLDRERGLDPRDARVDAQGILFRQSHISTDSFHQEKNLDDPHGQIFDVITNGTGLMSGHRWPILHRRPVRDHRLPARARAQAAGKRQGRARGR
jgi:hypothetical protein